MLPHSLHHDRGGRLLTEGPKYYVHSAIDGTSRGSNGNRVAVGMALVACALVIAAISTISGDFPIFFLFHKKREEYRISLQAVCFLLCHLMHH